MGNIEQRREISVYEYKKNLKNKTYFGSMPSSETERFRHGHVQTHFIIRVPCPYAGIILMTFSCRNLRRLDCFLRLATIDDLTNF